MTKKNFCVFALWTPAGILTEKIKRDEEFWKKQMREKIETFYYKCILPEIIDSRYARRQPIRNPPRE